jgi:hypothetical protein
LNNLLDSCFAYILGLEDEALQHSATQKGGVEQSKLIE